MPTLAPPALLDVTLPMRELVPPGVRHCFDPTGARRNFRVRRYDFGSSPQLLPLLRAFLDTCAAARHPDYRYVFTLLGTELAANALAHTDSGRPGSTYSLLCRYRSDGLTLSCRDAGRRGTDAGRTHLAAVPDAFARDVLDDPGPGDHGRGLALVDALATSWGDDGRTWLRTVWFHLAFDLADSAWLDL